MPLLEPAHTPTKSPAAADRLPDFLLTGAAKSATTTLHAHLRMHRALHVPDFKEPAFFCRDNIDEQDIEHYASLFRDAPTGTPTGECSTTYTRWPHTPDVPARIAQHIPDARLIYIVRHPVDRAYSHYAHHMRLGVTRTFEQALRSDDIYVDCSLYNAQIDRYRRFFPDERILLLRYEDLRHNPASVIARIESFLGVEHDPYAATVRLVKNNWSAWNSVRSRARATLDRVPLASRSIDAVPRTLLEPTASVVERSRVGRRIARRFEPPPMLPETRARLIDRFRQPNRELAELTGWDLSDWDR